jgi:hypothetical protein
MSAAEATSVVELSRHVAVRGGEEAAMGRNFDAASWRRPHREKLAKAGASVGAAMSTEGVDGDWGVGAEVSAWCRDPGGKKLFKT